MNMKKLVAGIMACCVVGGVIPSAVYNVPCGVTAVAAVDFGVVETGVTEDGFGYEIYGSFEDVYDDIKDEYIRRIISRDYAVITGYEGKKSALVIPEYIDNIPVTEIGNYMLIYNSSIASITLPDTIETIRYGAFLDCSALAKINLPDSIQSIENSVFSGCSSLASITIPDNVSSIEESTFNGCSSLASINIPDSIVNIGESAFNGCHSLVSMEIPDSVISIGNWAFSECSSLKSIKLPENLTAISEWCFSGCTNLKDIEIPESVLTIKMYAFLWCESLTNVSLPETIINIDETAFEECGNLSISGVKGSMAETYALENDIPFIDINMQLPLDILTGDANGDNTVDLADAVAIIQHIGNEAKYALSEQGIINADCTGDGKITGADALAIQKLEAGLIDKLPYIE